MAGGFYVYVIAVLYDDTVCSSDIVPRNFISIAFFSSWQFRVLDYTLFFLIVPSSLFFYPHIVQAFDKTFKGTVHPKKGQIFTKKFFASNELSTCSESCCGILQLCNVCKLDLGGVDRH